MSQQGPSAFSSDLRASAARGFGDGPTAPVKMRHPPGLFLLFAVEMWERFSYYGMRAMLVLYMTAAIADNSFGGLGWTREKAYGLYANYTMLAYFTPLIGGYFADKFLGTHRSMVLGGSIIAAGHFVLALESLSSFYAGLLLVVIGTGFFKPCITNMVGQLYGKKDARRDAAFTIFYMGVNLGAAIGPIVCAYLRVQKGWSYGFAAAGVGMVLSLITYLALRPKYLSGIGLSPKARLAAGDTSLHTGPLTREEKNGIAAIFIMAFFVIFFWSAFEQAGSSMNLFAEHRVNRVLPGYGEFPAEWYQSVNPVLILTLGPLFAMLWVRLGIRGREPATVYKVAMGLILCGLGFTFMVLAAYQSDAGGTSQNIIKVAPYWLMAAYFLHTCGELCLSPVGLSMVTKLAPAKFAALLLGTWYLANMTANKLAGNAAKLQGFFESRKLVLGGQADFWLMFVASPIIAGVLLLAISPLLKRLMAGRA